MRLENRLLCTEVKQRFEQGRMEPVRILPRVNSEDATTASSAHPAPEELAALENPNIQQDIAALAPGARAYIPLVVGIIVIVFIIIDGCSVRCRYSPRGIPGRRLMSATSPVWSLPSSFAA